MATSTLKSSVLNMIAISYRAGACLSIFKVHELGQLFPPRAQIRVHSKSSTAKEPLKRSGGCH